MKRVVKILAGVLMVYAVTWVAFYIFQDRFIFQSEALPTEYQFQFAQKFTEHSILTGDGEQLNALLFTSEQTSKGLILYFHGNAGNVQRWGQYATDFTSLGYDILMMDYRGYGKSTGSPSQENLYNDAHTLLEWSKKNIPHERVIFYGRSLGAAVATNLALQSNPDLLILETPFDKLASVLYFFPSRYSFANHAMLPNVKCKKVIIHGTDDRVVPLSSALRLKPLLSEEDTFVIIEGGGHNDLREFDEYHEILKNQLSPKP